MFVLADEALVLRDVEQRLDVVLRLASPVSELLATAFNLEQVLGLDRIHGAIELERVEFGQEKAIELVLILDFRKDGLLLLLLRNVRRLGQGLELFPDVLEKPFLLRSPVTQRTVLLKSVRLLGRVLTQKRTPVLGLLGVLLIDDFEQLSEDSVFPGLLQVTSGGGVLFLLPEHFWM